METRLTRLMEQLFRIPPIPKRLPDFIRVGDRLLRLSAITEIHLNEKNFDGDFRVRILQTSGLSVFRGAEALAIQAFFDELDVVYTLPITQKDDVIDPFQRSVPPMTPQPPSTIAL